MAPSGATADGITPLEDCEVLARVNGEVILACEVGWEADLMVRQRLATIPPDQRSQVTPETVAELKKGIMQQLMMGRLDMTLFYSDFRASVPQANLEAIQASLADQYTKQELPKLMKRLGAEDLAELEDAVNGIDALLDTTSERLPASLLEPDIVFVSEVHDELVQELVLDEFDRADYLRSTAILLRILREARESSEN